MQNMLSKLREKRANGEDNGFTLIELLVVVVILGILIAIAIPLYLNYRRGANDSAAKSDLRGAVALMEQCNADNSAYPSAITAVTANSVVTGYTACTGQTVKVSTGTTMTYFPASTTDFSNYIITATNSNGATKIYCYASAAGGGVKTTASAISAYATACP